MKKSFKLILAAGFIVCACIAGFMAGILWNASKSEGKVEQRALIDTSSLVNASIKPEENVVSNSSQDIRQSVDTAKESTDQVQATESIKVGLVNENAAGKAAKKSDITISDSNIVFTGGSEKGFTLTRKEAIAKAVESLPADTSFESDSPQFVISALNSAFGKYYTGYASLSKEKRYCFVVNATTGSVKESDTYVQEDQMVWYKASTDSSKVERVIQEYDMTAFNKIDLNIENLADCEIIPGDRYSVNAHFYGDNVEEYSLSCSNENKTLTISSKIKRQNYYNNNSRRTNFITITIPKGTVLEKIYADNLCGDVAMDSIQVKAVELQLTSGDVNVKNCTLDQLVSNVTSGDLALDEWTKGRLDIDSTSGDISINQITGGKVSIDTCSGDIKIQKLSGKVQPEISLTSGDFTVNEIYDGSFKLDLSSGDIYVKNTKNCDLDLSLSSGDVNVDKIESGKVSIDSSCSDVNIGELVTGTLKVGDSSGDITVNNVGKSGRIKIDIDTYCSDVNISCKGSKKDYSYRLENDFGDNTVGSTTSEKTLSQSNSSGNDITVKNGSGYNNLSFNQ